MRRPVVPFASLSVRSRRAAPAARHADLPGLFVLLLLALLPLFAVAPPARTQEPENLEPAFVDATIVYQDGRPSERARLLVSGPVVWITGQDLSAIFRAGRFWRPDVRKLTYRLEGREITLTVDSEIAVLDRTEFVHLDGPVLYRDGRVYVPLSFLLDPQGNPLPWVSQPITWDPVRKELAVGGRPPSLMSVELGSPYRLDLLLSEARDYRLVSTSRSRFVLRIPGIVFDRDRIRMPGDGAFFPGLRVSPLSDGVEVSFTVPDTIVGYQIVKVAEPHRISIVLTDDERFVRENSVEPFADTRSGAAVEIRTVVLDPGHGGGDAGAVSAGGRREADLTLALARDVALQLEDRLGIHAVLTRDDDRDVTIEARAGIANMAHADLFVSLHFDAWPSASVTGPRAVVAPGTPSAAGASGSGALNLSRWGESQAPMVGKARVLADALDREIAGVTNRRSRGVEEWPLPVLEAASMPAVFLELDALTAPGIDREMSEGDLQARLATAIVNAIDRCRREMP